MLNTTRTSGRKTQNFNEEYYGSLLSQFRPRPITNEEENNRALSYVESLQAKKKLSSEEKALYTLVVKLIADFEERVYPIEDSSPLEVLRHLMEANNLKQKDLIGVIGSKGVVSEIINGKRPISKEQAKTLAKHFNVDVSVFI